MNWHSNKYYWWRTHLSYWTHCIWSSHMTHTCLLHFDLHTPVWPESCALTQNAPSVFAILARSTLTDFHEKYKHCDTFQQDILSDCPMEEIVFIGNQWFFFFQIWSHYSFVFRFDAANATTEKYFEAAFLFKMTL